MAETGIYILRFYSKLSATTCSNLCVTKLCFLFLCFQLLAQWNKELTTHFWCFAWACCSGLWPFKCFKNSCIFTDTLPFNQKVSFKNGICPKGAVYSVSVDYDLPKRTLRISHMFIRHSSMHLYVLHNLTTAARHGLLVYKAKEKYKEPTNEPHWLTSLIFRKLFNHLFTINQLKAKALLTLTPRVKNSPLSTSCQYLQVGGKDKVCSCPKHVSDILPITLTSNILSVVTVYLQRLQEFSEEKLMWLLTINALSYFCTNLSLRRINSSHS